jgi:hypothetical protein
MRHRRLFRIAGQRHPSLITVEARLHDRTVRLLVDTGASALMLFQSRLTNPTSLPAGKLAKAKNVGGDFQRQAILIPEMHLGKENLGTERLHGGRPKR